MEHKFSENSNMKTISNSSYDSNNGRKTSAEIINEARLAIRDSQMSDSNFAPTTIKPLQTQRPFTPKNKERLLFGNSNTKKIDRPPSSFSLRYLQYETDLPITPPDGVNNIQSISASIFSKPLLHHPQTKFSNSNNSVTKKHNRSNSLAEFNDKIFNIGVKEPCKIKLPSLEHVRPLQKRKVFKTGPSSSLDNLPEETIEVSTDYDEIPQRGNETRNAFSSPQERTSFDETEPYFISNNYNNNNKIKQKKNLSECILLGPQNLNKIFENRQIIEHSECLFAQTEDNLRTVETVLKELNGISMDGMSATMSEDVIKGLLDELYECMGKEDMLNAKITSKMKIKLLKCLYRFVESKNENVLINIAKIILAIKVTGNNLSGVCKLIFKVSKNDKNDDLFFQKNLLESFLDALGRSSPIDDAEACVYGYGAVKFLTMNQKLLTTILNLGILQLMVLHMKIINNAKVEKSQMSPHTTHALFQLSGALRNLVSEEDIYETIISCGAIMELCHSLDIFSADTDIVTNIARTLSTISSNDCCCDSLVEHKHIYMTFIKLFKLYAAHEEIIVRLTYTLGNIVAKIDNTRIKYFNEAYSIEGLINLWKMYLDRTLQICSLKFDDKNVSTTNTEDVMIKVIRVIANLVINPDIGKRMNEKFGEQLIDEFLKVLISNPFKANDELVLSILSTLNNLSFYYSSDLEVDIFHIKQINIVEGISEYTKSKNKECVIESMRILGNLSRSKITRSYIAETGIFGTLIALLDKADLTLLKTTVGVFVNLMSDTRSRLLFKQKLGVTKLISILTNFCEIDWMLGTFVCQVLWNYCIDTTNLYELISELEIQQLLVLLADYLDEEKLFGVNENHNIDDTDIYVSQEYLIWEEFANVATNLLEKIEYFLDTFDQIELPNDVINKKSTHTKETVTAW